MASARIVLSLLAYLVILEVTYSHIIGGFGGYGRGIGVIGFGRPYGYGGYGGYGYGGYRPFYPPPPPFFGPPPPPLPFFG